MWWSPLLRKETRQSGSTIVLLLRSGLAIGKQVHKFRHCNLMIAEDHKLTVWATVRFRPAENAVVFIERPLFFRAAATR